MAETETKSKAPCFSMNLADRRKRCPDYGKRCHWHNKCLQEGIDNGRLQKESEDIESG